MAKSSKSSKYFLSNFNPSINYPGAGQWGGTGNQYNPNFILKGNYPLTPLAQTANTVGNSSIGNNSLVPITVSNPTTPLQPTESSFGTKLGGLYNKMSSGLKNGPQGFGTDFKTAAGLPDDFELWNSKGGIQVGNLGNIANVASGAVSGLKAVKGLSDSAETANDIDSLYSDVLASYMSNPLASNYLTTSDKQLIRQIQNSGDINNDASFGDAISGGIRGIPKALLSAGAGLLSGGVPGALIGGAGSLINSGIKGYQNAQGKDMARLEALYSNLQDAEQEYKAMKRPSGMLNSGLASRAYRNLY